jgi:hypothetical protein
MLCWEFPQVKSWNFPFKSKITPYLYLAMTYRNYADRHSPDFSQKELGYSCGRGDSHPAIDNIWFAVWSLL